MALAPGSRLGQFEVTALIGAGGMGEVYRATDTTLHRDVALKILPDAFARDPDRLARFEREAQVLASLNHPHIAQIFGVEKAGGMTALVMELVSGVTLAAFIASHGSGYAAGSSGSRKGPEFRGTSTGEGLPLDEALRIARQIADALGAAHAQGIIHRDLKPANVSVREDGTVKVLDFGLAKALESPAAPDSANSPTTTSPAMTQAGVILGTAAYMSPEQARGRRVDQRADVWAFGCVLFEMLTGRQAFEAEDVPLTISRILQGEPEFELLPKTVSAPVRRTLELCLTKDVQQRLSDMQDIRLALDGAFETPSPAVVASVSPRGSRWRRILSTAVAALMAAGVCGTAVWIATRSLAPRLTRLVIPTAGSMELAPAGGSRDIVISPDGQRVAYRAATQVVVRSLDDLEPKTLRVGAVSGLFFSPDGRQLGFTGQGRLQRVPVAGGPAVPIAATDGSFRGATWTGDSIVFATLEPATGLQRVSPEGGPVTVLTRPDRSRGEHDHIWPEALPDGHSVLFTITSETGGLDAARIAVLDLASLQIIVLPLRGTHARYVRSGHLVFGAGNALHAVPFDPTSRMVFGTPVPVLNQAPVLASGAVQADVAEDGTLVYIPDLAPVLAPRSLVWVDRQGRETPIAGVPPRPYRHPRLSPDGTRLALSDGAQPSDLWVLHLSPPRIFRVTDDPADDETPAWTSDGRLLFTSTRTGSSYQLFVQRGDGTGRATSLLQGRRVQLAPTPGRNDTEVIFTEVTSSNRGDVELLNLATGQVTALVESRADERGGTVSPDGRWLAYESDRSGRFEIYVQPFPSLAGGNVVPVSADGGVQPKWAPHGKELFYVDPDGALIAVRVQLRDSTWSAGAPVKLIEGRYATRSNQISTIVPQYDTIDGQRFLMLKDEARAGGAPISPQIIVVQNWLQELRRLVPAK
jgi:serine/threonine protein kinase